MLSLFRRNLLANILMLLVFAIALLAPWLFIGDDIATKASSFPWAANQLAILDENKYISSILSLSLIFLQAILLNNMVTRHKLSRALSTIPAAVFILFAAIVMEGYRFHPILLANVFCLLSLNSLFKIYKRHLPIATIFNSGFWMAMAIIIYQPYFIYFFVLLIGLYSMRNLSIRESLQMFLGLLAPLGFIAVVAFYFGGLQAVLVSILDNFSLPEFNTWTLQNLLKPILALVLILIAVYFHHEIKKKKKFDAIKKIEIAYWLILTSVLTLFLTSPLQEPHLFIVSIPLAISLGLLLEMKRNHIIKEFFFLLVIGIYVGFVLDVI